MEYSTDTRGIFEIFDRSFDDGLGPPIAALTFVRDDQSQGVVVKVLGKAVIQHTSTPTIPTVRRMCTSWNSRISKPRQTRWMTSWVEATELCLTTALCLWIAIANAAATAIGNCLNGGH